MYVTADEIYATAGITSTEVPEASVNQFILGSEAVADRITNTTYWTKQDNGTASAGATTTTLVDSTKSWTDDDYIGQYVYITSGTGSGQIRKVIDNDSTNLTISTVWSTVPDTTSVYEIHYTAQNPYVAEELRDGDDTTTIFLDKYPLVKLETVTSNSVSVTPSNIYQYKDQGKLLLNSNLSPEVNFWTSSVPQANVFAYYWGVYEIPYLVKRYVMVCASLMALMAQSGGTHNIPSTYQLPEGSVSIGQAYVNIRGAWDMLNKEKVMIEQSLIRYTSFA